MLLKLQRLVGSFLLILGVFQTLSYGQSLTNEPPKADIASGDGAVYADVSNILGQSLPARVELRQRGKTTLVKRIEVPGGRGEFHAQPGSYDAYVYAYDHGVPILIDIQPLEVSKKETAYLLESLLEGSSGDLPLTAFDKDHDLALDRVELAAGTDPADASSVPGQDTIPIDSTVFKSKPGWYRGDLQAYTNHSIGKESVAELVKRAEAEGLDFLAITDRNTMAAVHDPAFKSKSVVLIPALEWGTDENGYALLYGPRTFPALATTSAEAQATMIRVQAQKGAFAIAHPCFPGMPWQWRVTLPNAIEVWCRDWRAVPPITLDQLRPEYREIENERYLYPIGHAAATPGISANDQALLYNGFMLEEGVRAGVIGGSHSASPSVPLGRPLTYVYAKEKSVVGILEGILYGRTYVTAGPDAPRVHMAVDIGKDKTIDASFGATIPLGVPSLFVVTVWGAKDKRLEVLCNGNVMRSAIVPEDPFIWGFEDTPNLFSFYQVRVTEPPSKEGFGKVDVLAISSPIYADVQRSAPAGGDAGKAWIPIQDDEGPAPDPNWQPPAGSKVIDLKPENLLR